MRIPLCKPYIATEALKALADAVLRTTCWDRPHVRLAERIADHFDLHYGHVVLTRSSTAALEAAGRIIYGDRTIKVSPLTWPSTYLWASDCEWVDLGMTSYPPVVDVVVDLWGIPSRLPIAKNCPGILDAAHRFLGQEHPAILKSKQVAAITYSFAPQKELPCWEGGAVVCADRELARAIHTYIDCGTENRALGLRGEGTKGYMTGPTSAFLCAQLAHLPEARRSRTQGLLWYEGELRGSGVRLLTHRNEASGHLCVVSIPRGRRDDVRTELCRLGIGSGHHYPLNLEQRLACPDAAGLSDRILSLPLYDGITREEVQEVCHVVRETLASPTQEGS